MPYNRKMERLTESQFTKLLKLTSVQKGSATCDALYRHLVLGYSLGEAQKAAGISQSTMSAGMKRLKTADIDSRDYVASLNP